MNKNEINVSEWKSTWHYKLLHHLYGEVPNRLCPYWKKLIATILSYAILGLCLFASIVMSALSLYFIGLFLLHILGLYSLSPSTLSFCALTTLVG